MKTNEDQAFIEYLDRLYPNIPKSYGEMLYKAYPSDFSLEKREWIKTLSNKDKENLGISDHHDFLINDEGDRVGAVLWLTDKDLETYLCLDPNEISDNSFQKILEKMRNEYNDDQVSYRIKDTVGLSPRSFKKILDKCYLLHLHD